MAAADIINGVSGTQHWLIVGVPLAKVGLTPEVGEVEFFPVVDSPTAPRFKLRAPSGNQQAYAHFGASLVAGDVDGDGWVDLVVGAPNHDVGTVIDQGRAFVFFGPWFPTNPTPYTDWAYLDVLPAEASVSGETGGLFGFSVAIGNLNNNSSPDIVVGAPRAADSYSNPRIPDVGAVDVFLDVVRNSGLTPTHRYQHVYQELGRRISGNLFGYAIDAGQMAIDHLGASEEPFGDLAVGAPGYDEIHGYQDVGILGFYFGHTLSPGLPVWDRTAPWAFEALPFIDLADPVPSSQIAIDMDLEDYDGDGWEDLAAGGPGTAAGPAGYVTLFRGGAHALLHYGAPNPPDTTRAKPSIQEPGDQFGYSVLWIDGEPGVPFKNLAVGAIGDNLTDSNFMGYVCILKGSASPLLLWVWDAQLYSDPTPNAGERFGFSTARALRLGTAVNDLVVSAPHANVPGANNAGEVFVFNR